jgi:hypothetical protein
VPRVAFLTGLRAVIPLLDTMASDARQVPTNVLVPASHREALKQLSSRTRISQSEYLREAVADLLAKYAQALEDAGADAA